MSPPFLKVLSPNIVTVSTMASTDTFLGDAIQPVSDSESLLLKKYYGLEGVGCVNQDLEGSSCKEYQVI